MKYFRSIAVCLLTACFGLLVACSPRAPESLADSDPVSAVLVGFAGVAGDGLDTTTGGEGGGVVKVTSYAGLKRAVGDNDKPAVVWVSGTITRGNQPAMMDVRANKTITGVGDSPTIDGFGFNIDGSHNIIIANLTFMNAADDAINITNTTHHIWIHHNTFKYSRDGSIDIKRGSSYITVAWNHFAGTDKTLLLGHSDDNADQDIGRLKVTYHHNWFDDSHQRNPRVRFGQAHVFNNYYVNNAGYGVASAQKAGVVLEGNYFQNVRMPASTGDVIRAPAGGFVEGDIVERNNIYDNSGAPQTRGKAFDPGGYYDYSLDKAANVPMLVMAGAGAN